MRRAAMTLVLALTATMARAQTSVPAGPPADVSAFDRGVTFAQRFLGESEDTPKDGFYPEFGNMITGSGWISAGPGYRRHFLNDRAMIEGSAAVSWREYRIAQARFELSDLAKHHLSVGSQVFWQDATQIDYFGIGANSSEGARSEYGMRSTDVIGYGTVHANRWLAIDGTIGWLRHPTLSSPSGWFNRDFPNALTAFPNDPGVSAQPDFLHGTVSVTADIRDHKGYARRGGVYRASASAYSDRDDGAFSYRRYELEGVQYVPVISDVWTLAFHGWSVFSDTSAGNSVPFYMLPGLGGQNTLRGFHDYRFHDRNMLLASAESRWALMRRLDLAAFFDAGSVSPDVRGLDLRKTSWGGGLRVHTPSSALARFDIAHSVEGWQFVFRLNDPFRLLRLTRRTATTPFVP